MQYDPNYSGAAPGQPNGYPGAPQGGYPPYPAYPQDANGYAAYPQTDMNGYPAYPAQDANGYPVYPPQDPNGYAAYPQQDPNGYPVYPQDPNGYPAYPQDPNGYTGYPQTGYQPYPQGGEYPQDSGYQPWTAEQADTPEAQPEGENAQPEEGTEPERPHFAEGQGVQMKPRKKKKGGLRLSGIQVAVILAALALAGFYAWTVLMPQGFNTAVIRAGNAGAEYTGDALIVRNETPYDAEGVTSIEYIAEEGKPRARNLQICSVYSSGFSTKEMTTLQDHREQLRDYIANLLSEETIFDARMNTLSENVLSLAKEIRSTIASGSGNLSNLEAMLDTAITARANYIRTKYATDQRLSRLLDDEQAQRQRIESWTKQYAATNDGIVSFYSDGFEYALTTSNYENYTPSEVRRMINGRLPEGAAVPKNKTTIYRVVRDDEWVVLLLAHQTNWNPVNGETYQLKIEQFENSIVDATIESFTRSGGELLVRLRVRSGVNGVLYTRSCTATLGDSIATLLVPSRAIYEQDGMKGVVITDGTNNSFVPVKVVSEGSGDAYITSLTPGLLSEGMSVLLF